MQWPSYISLNGDSISKYSKNIPPTMLINVSFNFNIKLQNNFKLNNQHIVHRDSHNTK
jgi:hypothetical protein